jgi:hypothetical protein
MLTILARSQTRDTPGIMQSECYRNRRKLASVLLLFFWFSQVLSAADGQGRITGGSYENRDLSMVVPLPNAPWHFIGKATHPGLDSPRTASKCPGPFCGGLAINVSLASEPQDHPIFTIFLGAYKPEPQYLDVQKYPLKDYATVMVVRSLGTAWDAEGQLTLVRLGGKPAYKLILRNRKVPSANAFAYVCKSKGYIFIVVGTALHDAEALQFCLETMRLGNINQ